MKDNGQRQTSLRDYLLGNLNEEAMQQIEERLFTDEEEFQEIQMEEDVLVDEYLRDGLSDSERRHFEGNLLSTNYGRGKLRFAAAWRNYVRAYWMVASDTSRQAQKNGVSPSFWSRLFGAIPTPAPAWGAATAALVVALVFGVSSTVSYRQIEKELDEVSAERVGLLAERESIQQQLAREQAVAEELRTQLERHLVEKPTPPTRTVVTSTPSFMLTPGLLRGAGELARVHIPSDSSLVTLLLDIGIDEYPRYRATLFEAAGDEVWTHAKLQARTTPTEVVVPLTLPAELLASGDYYVRLVGVVDDETTAGFARYDFRVTRD